MGKHFFIIIHQLNINIFLFYHPEIPNYYICHLMKTKNNLSKSLQVKRLVLHFFSLIWGPQFNLEKT